MKEDELRKVAECAICKKPFGHTGIPLFYRVCVRHIGIKMDSVRRQDGLAMMIGNSALAAVMGENEELTETITENEITICHHCALYKKISIAEITEINS